MVSLIAVPASSGTGILLQHVVDIDADSIFIHQSATEIAGNGNQQAAEYRQIEPLRPDVGSWFWQTQQPIQRSQRQQHYRQYRMAPGCDQAADLAYQQHIDQSGQASYPAANSAYTCQPQTGPGPESIVVVQKSQIRRYQTDKGRNREMDQTRVQRMAKNYNLAGDGLHRHNKLRLSSVSDKPRCYQSSLAAVCLAAVLPNLTGCSGPFSSLDPKGPAAAEVALLWWGMFGFATLVLLAVTALWLYAIKRQSNAPLLHRTSTWLYGGGLALPLLGISILLIAGIPVGQRMAPLMDSNAMQIEVTGHQWFWQVRYRDYAIELTDELHIPVNTPVYLHLSSADVIHSFWVPRLGVKLDMLPGRKNVLKLEATEAGIYRGHCAEYCGLGHAHMQFSVTAYEKEAFAAWLQEFSIDE